MVRFGLRLRRRIEKHYGDQSQIVPCADGPSAIAAFDWQGDDGCWSIDVYRNDGDAHSDADVSGCDPASGTMPMPTEPNVPNVSIVIIDGAGDWELNVDVPDVVVAPTVYDTAPE